MKIVLKLYLYLYIFFFNKMIYNSILNILLIDVFLYILNYYLFAPCFKVYIV